ncbi:collagen alpha-1(XXIII) chain-like [Lethenteron reissneri]|uniref:collagen alpha-1(XXIII) chain-like n=1 Tax=Lethenteron reissneri TaxID=7753 RepID=UPI002AB72C89|nr:collagen alpha-1(XXIII) chain-like [Lethenteron reissneri]
MEAARTTSRGSSEGSSKGNSKGPACPLASSAGGPCSPQSPTHFVLALSWAILAAACVALFARSETLGGRVSALERSLGALPAAGSDAVMQQQQHWDGVFEPRLEALLNRRLEEELPRLRRARETSTKLCSCPPGPPGRMGKRGRTGEPEREKTPLPPLAPSLLSFPCSPG